MPSAPPRALTIAGSDSGGGAGIQADLKTFQAFGVYGASVLTALTAQNTRTVSAIEYLPPAFVTAQLDAVLGDIGGDAAKMGMIGNAAIAAALADCLDAQPIDKLVIDPVMIAKSGDALLTEDARRSLIERILPHAYVVTPNVPEAEVLAGMTIASAEAVHAAGPAIHALGPRYVLLKGGHLEGPEATDWLYDGATWTAYGAPRIDTKNTHGTGCTYSAAIAAGLAWGLDVHDAVRQAKTYVTGAIEHALPVGGGHGPLNHGWRQ